MSRNCKCVPPLNTKCYERILDDTAPLALSKCIYYNCCKFNKEKI